jgi:hypothetical protein
VVAAKYNLFHPDHMTEVPDGQRALVLQGSSSLGAYEAGAVARCSKTNYYKSQEQYNITSNISDL